MTAWSGIIAIEGETTGDGRMIERGALTWGEGPWPLKFDMDETDHTAPVVGTVTRVWRDENLIRGEGVIADDSENPEVQAWAKRAVELLEDGAVGVSVELDAETVELRIDKAAWDERQKQAEAMMEEAAEPETPEVKDGRVVVDTSRFDDFLQVLIEARLRALAIVDTPAFADAEVGIAATIGIAAALSKKDLTAAFANPQFGDDGDDDPRLVWQEPQRPEETGGWGCPLTLDGDRLYGHATLKFRCHGSFAACLPADQMGGDITRFLVGDATGTGIPTGPIVLNTTHGVMDNGKVKSTDWLAHTGLAVADVAAGFDQHGMWVAGTLRPGLTERERAALAGSTLSGEWHRNPSTGKPQLIGILAVNAPGYLVQRVRTGVAASMFTVGAQCCTETLETRVARLEDIAYQALRTGV